MEMQKQCHCCLQRPPARDLRTPFTHLGITESYPVMMEECFAVHLTLAIDGECGICLECVDQLREACHFKLQVLESQAKLRECWGWEQHVKEEETPILSGVACADDEFSSSTMPADRDSRLEPHLALKDCTVRLERCDAVQTDSQQKTNKDKQHTYVCDTCGKAFDDKVVLVRHIRAHAQEKYSKKSKFDTSKDSKTSKLYSSEIYNKKFPKEHNLIEHNIIQSGKKRYSCDICRKQFARKDSLPNHLLIHAGQKPYCCEICKRRFSQKGSLMRHKAFVHREMIPEDERRMRTMKIMCTICNKPFVNLKQHIVIHTGDKPHYCDICQKRFTQKKNMIEHKLIHTGERPYSCTVCAKTFRKNSHLYRHERLHTGEKPYSCEICKRKFRQSHHLLDHERTHVKPRKKRGRSRKTN